jgi:hypothetical protein
MSRGKCSSTHSKRVGRYTFRVGCWSACCSVLEQVGRSCPSRWYLEVVSQPNNKTSRRNKSSTRRSCVVDVQTTTSCRVSVLDSRSILDGSTEALEIRLCWSCWWYAVRGDKRRNGDGCLCLAEEDVQPMDKVGYAIVFHVLTTIVNRESVGRCRRRCQCPFRRRRRRRVSMSWWIRSDR